MFHYYEATKYHMRPQTMIIDTEEDRKFYQSVRQNWDNTGRVPAPYANYTDNWQRWYLQQLKTKSLIKHRNDCYRYGGYVQLWDLGPGFSLELIKEVLATREHIPNKKEAKMLRREASKAAKRNNGRGARR